MNKDESKILQKELFYTGGKVFVGVFVALFLFSLWYIYYSPYKNCMVDYYSAWGLEKDKKYFESQEQELKYFEFEMKAMARCKEATHW